MNFKKHTKNFKKRPWIFNSMRNSTVGFTITELIVVVSIFVLLTGLVLIRFSVFDSKITVTNLAYDVALSIREAQSYAVNVSGTNISGPTTFDTGYGIHFRRTTPDSYDFFADRNRNKRFHNSELIDVYSLRGGYIISDICGMTLTSGIRCFSANDFVDISVVFERPDLDAIIKSPNPPYDFESISITILSPKGETRKVNVFSTGQISVENP